MHLDPLLSELSSAALLKPRLFSGNEFLTGTSGSSVILLWNYAFHLIMIVHVLALILDLDFLIRVLVLVILLRFLVLVLEV